MTTEDATRVSPSEVTPMPATNGHRRGGRRKRAAALELPLLPRWDTVVYPGMVAQLVARNERSQRAMEYAMAHEQRVAVVARRTPPPGELTTEDMYTMGTEATVGRILRMPDGLMNIWLQGERRIRIEKLRVTDGFYWVTADPVDEPEPEEEQPQELALQARMREVLSLFQQTSDLSNGKIPQEAYIMAMNATEPGALADLVASSLSLDLDVHQEMLEMLDPVPRLERAHVLLAQELEMLKLQDQIHNQVQEEVDKNQREYFLREQLRAIQHELGQIDPIVREAEQLREKMEQAAMPEEVQKRVAEDLDRLASMPPGNPEVSVVRNYLDWLVNLPWTAKTEDSLDIKEAQVILDRNHYGLAKVKERIVEYMAVRKLTQERLRSPILCFVGPPGVGKTSLGKSIAEALGRKFVRISLGGIRDEAEIRGHRRTYVGALPGRIIQTMRLAGTVNPVFMLDEIDKVGNDFRGDPSAALLEVLDPEQNHSFSDHYLEIPYNLSKVLFIATANMLEPIIPALRDRLEIIELPGYTEHEKLSIARKFLVSKQIQEHGLEDVRISFSDGALRTIIEDYTREAGVRSLEREIGNICRKVAKRVAANEPAPTAVGAQSIPGHLGPKRFFAGTAEEDDQIGVATGVARTEMGGDVLAVEVVLLEGKGKLILTGQLGEVMRESAQAAVSYARSRADLLRIDPKTFETRDIHIHVPAGAVPKDGPSAGITLATALISALTQRPVSRDVAMTGEITLRGRVLPVGGLKEKVLAAHRAGIRTFILPAQTRKDLDDLPSEVRREMRFVFVDHMDQVLATAIREPELQLL